MTNLLFFLCFGAAVIQRGQCADCHLPPDSGSCSNLSEAKEESRYFYSAKNWKCTEMPYVGCGGNSNNFKTLEECNKECGKRLVKRSLATAIPAAKGNAKCSLNNVTYDIGNEIPGDETRCRFCTCVDTSDGLGISASIECRSGECFDSPPTGCVSIYKPGNCCSDVYCPVSNKCEYKGKSYYDGQPIYAEEYPCMTCECNKNWKGMLTTEGEVCVEQTCYLHDTIDFIDRENCVPVYDINRAGKQRCCYSDLKCNVTKIITRL